MSDPKELFSGAEISIASNGKGNYIIQQLPIDGSHLPASSGGHIPISWSHGPLSIVGWVDPKIYSIFVDVNLMGIYLASNCYVQSSHQSDNKLQGSFTGVLQDDVNISIKLSTVDGDITFHLRYGNEAWAKCHLQLTFGGEYAAAQRLCGWDAVGDVVYAKNKYSGPRHFSVAF